MDGVEVTKNSNTGEEKWSPKDHVYYWPEISNTDLDFCFFAPFSVKPTIEGATTLAYAEQTINPNSWDKDIMYTQKSVGLTKTSNGTSGVNAIFNHALAQIKFTVKGTNLIGTGVKYTIKVKKVVVEGIQTKGTLSMGLVSQSNTNWQLPDNEIWTASAAETVALNIDKSLSALTLTTSPQDFDKSYYVLPQVIKDKVGIVAKVTYDLTSAVGAVTETKEITSSIKLKDVSAVEYWQMNKIITYNITFDPTNNLTPIFFNPTVNSWGAASGDSTINPNAK